MTWGSRRHLRPRPGGVAGADGFVPGPGDGLDPVPGDRFADVSGVHEENINAIAEEGVTLGCDEAGTLFCPDDSVRRDQMASFIGRALGLEPIEPPPGNTTTTPGGSTTTTPQSSDCTNGTTISESDLETFGEYIVHNNNWNDSYGGTTRSSPAPPTTGTPW